MNGRFIKYSIICIGIVIGLATSVFLLARETNFISVPKASAADLSGNFSNGTATMQSFLESDLIYPNLFSGLDRQTNVLNQQTADQAPVIRPKAENNSEITQPDSIPSIKKTEVPKATHGTECPAKKDRPSISSRNHKNHMDEDCCSDYDEWPNPSCAYTAKDFQIMLPGPTPGHIKHH